MSISKNTTPTANSLLAPISICGLCMILIMLSGCNTPQQKAHNTPKPIPPPPQQTSQKDSSSDTSGGQQKAAEPLETETAEADSQEGSKKDNKTAPNQSTPSQLADNEQTIEGCEPTRQLNSPDVEITDVPLDEYGKPIEPNAEKLAASAKTEEECKTAKNSQDEQRQADKQKNNQQAQPQNQQAGQQAPPSGLKTGSAQTNEEKLAAANANMDSRLAAFDDLMRRAREAAEKQRAAANSNPDGQYGGGYGGQYDGQGGNQRVPEVRGAGGQADTSSGLGHTPDQSGQTRPGDYRQVATGPVPANMPDGRDDDIVARQLREAATKESDPVLREKLWEEYKKYKSGGR